MSSLKIIKLHGCSVPHRPPFKAGPSKQETFVGNDPSFTLGEWAMLISLLIMEYGEDVVLTTNGGYNNVSLELTNEQP